MSDCEIDYEIDRWIGEIVSYCWGAEGAEPEGSPKPDGLTLTCAHELGIDQKNGIKDTNSRNEFLLQAVRV